MKKLIALICLLVILLTGCAYNTEEAEPETHIVSGTIVDMRITHSTRVVVETADGIKISVYELSPNYSSGLSEGDKVCFKVQNATSGYEIVGYGFEDETTVGHAD